MLGSVSGLLWLHTRLQNLSQLRCVTKHFYEIHYVVGPWLSGYKLSLLPAQTDCTFSADILIFGRVSGYIWKLETIQLGNPSWGWFVSFFRKFNHRYYCKPWLLWGWKLICNGTRPIKLEDAHIQCITFPK